MFKDKIVAGATIGLLADVVKLTVNYLSFKLDYTTVVFWQIIAALFLTRDDLNSPVALLIGGVADLVMTMFLGIIFMYLIYFTGKDTLWIKGIGFAMLVWVILFGVVLEQLITDKIPPEPLGIITTIVAHFFFGLSLAIFTKLLVGKIPLFAQDLKELIQQPQSIKLLSPKPIRKVLVTRNEGFKKPRKL